MSKIDHILCVIDPSATSQPAFERAAELAGKTGARLELFICYYIEFLSGFWIFDPPSLQQARRNSLERQKGRLDELAKEHRNAGLNIVTTAIWDHPLYEGIVRHACATNADIVFKDTHSHAALGITGLSNTDWSLIRTCPVPLWLVKGNEFAGQPNLIAAIDPFHEHDKPAELDEEIIDFSRQISGFLDADLHAFHAFDTSLARPKLTDFREPADTTMHKLEDQIRSDHQSQFDDVLQKNSIDKSHAHLVDGHTHEVLPQVATELDACVVVMGAVARNRLKRIFIGATAERTLDRLPCDLVVVKPSWFESPVKMAVETAA